MNVVFVSRFPVTVDSPRGGVETATLSLAQSLVTYQQANVHVVTLERELDDVMVESHGDITVHRLPRSRWPMMFDVYFGPTQQRLQAYIKTLKPDIVHFHETWGLAAYRYDHPTIFTVHGFDSLNLVTEKAKLWRLRSWLWKRFEDYGLKRSTHIISIAPYVTRQMGQLRAKIYDIWNAISPKYFDIERQLEQPTLLFLGWINHRKNPLTLVKVAKQLVKDIPNINVELCGEVSDKPYGETVAKAIEQHGLSGQVKLVGRVGMSEVMSRLAKSHVLILPSLQENAPMVIAEAMAAQVPVVGADLCGIPDMVRNNVTGYLTQPFDEDFIAQKAYELLTNIEANQDMGQAARARAYTLFHPKSVSAQTLDAYRDVIAAFSR